MQFSSGRSLMFYIRVTFVSAARNLQMNYFISSQLTHLRIRFRVAWIFTPYAEPYYIGYTSWHLAATFSVGMLNPCGG